MLPPRRPRGAGAAVTGHRHPGEAREPALVQPPTPAEAGRGVPGPRRPAPGRRGERRGVAYAPEGARDRPGPGARLPRRPQLALLAGYHAARAGRAPSDAAAPARRAG